MRFIVFIFIFISFSVGVYACDSDKEPEIRIGRASNFLGTCLDLYISYPNTLGEGYIVNPPRLIYRVNENVELGAVLERFYLKQIIPDYTEDTVSSYFCLPEEFLDSARIEITYFFASEFKTAGCSMDFITEDIRELLEKTDNDSVK